VYIFLETCARGEASYDIPDTVKCEPGSLRCSDAAMQEVVLVVAVVVEVVEVVVVVVVLA
jgi:hypothetical protein